MGTIFCDYINFPWRLLPKAQIITHHWYRKWLDTKSSTSHYQNHCWPRSLMPYGIIKSQQVERNLTLANIFSCIYTMVLCLTHFTTTINLHGYNDVFLHKIIIRWATCILCRRYTALLISHGTFVQSTHKWCPICRYGGLLWVYSLNKVLYFSLLFSISRYIWLWYIVSTL